MGAILPEMENFRAKALILRDIFITVVCYLDNFKAAVTPDEVILLA
jgi:hypothetical protein